MATCWWQLVFSFLAFLVCSSSEKSLDTSLDCLKRKNLDLLPTVLSYGNCFQLARNMTYQEYTGFINITIQDVIETDKDLCRNDVIVPCFLSFDEAIKICLSQYENEDHINNILRSSTNALSYVCQNNAQLVKDFIGEKSSACMRKSSDALNNCSVSKNLKWRWFSLSYFGDDCRYRAELITCMLAVLDQCDDKTAENFFLGVVRSMLSLTSCRDIISSEYSYLSSSFIISPCLLLYYTFSFVILLQFL